MRSDVQKHPSTLVNVNQCWRVLCAQSVPAALRAKLADAEADEPDPDNPPGVAMPGGGWISGPCT